MKRLIIALLALSFHANAQVSYERLRNAANETDNWMTYSGTYRSERYSALDQINKDNVDDLKVIWAYQMQPATNAGNGLVETTPIVLGGRIRFRSLSSSISSI